MAAPESPPPPRSLGFYLFRSYSSIPPPSPLIHDSFLHEVFLHFARQISHSVTSVLLPIILLPFHFFFLFLSIVTTLIAMVFLSYRALVVYLNIIFNTIGQIYSDYLAGGKGGRQRRDLLRTVAFEREESVRMSNLRFGRNRSRGVTIA
jgi:hypothetical protein